MTMRAIDRFGKTIVTRLGCAALLLALAACAAFAVPRAAGDERGQPTGAVAPAAERRGPSVPVARQFRRAVGKSVAAAWGPLDFVWGAVRAAYDTVEAQLFCGRCWVRKKEYERAIERFSAAIGLAPARSGSYAARANAWSLMKNTEQALADRNEQVRLAPKDPHALL